MPGLPQHVKVLRNNVSARHEPELTTTVTSHQALKVAPASVFTSDLKAARQVVELLVGVECLEAGRFLVLSPSSNIVVRF